MNDDLRIRAELSAAKALGQWRSFFTEETCRIAQKIATESGKSDVITLRQLQEAAMLVVSTSLPKAISFEDHPNVSADAA